MTEESTEPHIDPAVKQEENRRPLSNVAQIVSAVISCLGFALSIGVFATVIYQVILIKNNAQNAAARQVYMSYSEAGLKYPEFVEPDLAKLKGDPEKYVQYKSYIYHMLFAYDEIFAAYDDPEWHKSFEADVKYQMEYICNDMNRTDDETYFPKMRMILKQTREKCPSQN